MFVNVFLLGAFFGSHPYREMQLSGDLNANAALTQIGVQQSHTLLLVTYLSLALIAACLVFGIRGHYRNKWKLI
jgi:hypothetical protein